MTIRDFLGKLGIRTAGKPGIAPVQTTSAISAVFEADAARQQFDSVRRRPLIETNNAEALGRRKD